MIEHQQKHHLVPPHYCSQATPFQLADIVAALEHGACSAETAAEAFAGILE